MKKLTAIIIGVGSRGCVYANAMKSMPEKYQVVAVADPGEIHRNTVKQWYDIPEENCYTSWEEILAQPKMADFAIIATQDNMHYEPALKAIELGYNLLLEKPVAQTAKECADIAVAAEKKGVKVLVCHVLRYTDFYGRVKQLVMDGVIGDVMSVIQVEAVGNAHQSHSYVRGNWHSTKKATPMLLAKCSHDLDIIQWILDKPCKKVQSFGSLTHFTPENAPAGAPKRCIDGGCPIESTCPYSSRKLYYDDKENHWFRGVATGKFDIEGGASDEEVLQALKTTDYGLCVYQADNDVVDHQVVNMEFEGGVTANLTMNAFNKGGRYIRLFGTKGELFANMADTEITVYTFEDKETRKIKVRGGDESIVGGHGGGDTGIMRELYDYFTDGYDGFKAADISTSVKNHLIGFAAEKSRANNTVEDVDDFIAGYGMKNQYK